jgi:hypothetical protein
MFRHQSAICREFTNTKITSPNLNFRIREVEFWTCEFCVRKHPVDGTLVPKHVGVIFIMNSVLWFVIYCNLLCAFVGQYSDYTKTHAMSHIESIGLPNAVLIQNETGTFSGHNEISHLHLSYWRISVLFTKRHLCLHFLCCVFYNLKKVQSPRVRVLDF